MIAEWVTPAGHAVSMNHRAGTNDWNVINSINRPGDEYALPVGLAGWAIDIGGHIGTASIALALDNPDLQVLCVEPIPDNLEQIRANVAANGLGDRVKVIDGAAGTDGLVIYGGTGDSAEHHAFIGNNHWALAAEGSQSVTAKCWSLSALMRKAKATSIAFLKIDCEGCEWSFLADPAVGKVERIVGEWHPPGTYDQLRVMLGKTHMVTRLGEHGFSAVRR